MLIDTGDSSPIRQHVCRHSPFEKEVIRTQVEEMLRAGGIRVAQPVVIVRRSGKKPQRGWRFCVDFRRVNAVTQKDVHPLQQIDDILDLLQGSRDFTTLDLNLRLLAGGNLRRGQAEDGIYMRLRSIRIQCRSIPALQRHCNIPEDDKQGFEQSPLKGVPGLLGRHCNFLKGNANAPRGLGEGVGCP